jgi:hypothetical protein
MAMAKQVGAARSNGDAVRGPELLWQSRSVNGVGYEVQRMVTAMQRTEVRGQRTSYQRRALAPKLECEAGHSGARANRGTASAVNSITLSSTGCGTQ